MSPSRNHLTRPHVFIAFNAVWHPLLGRKPVEHSKNRGLRTCSITSRAACWTILSRGLAIPRGRRPPLGLGIQTRREGRNLNLPALRAIEVLGNQILGIPSRSSKSDPLVILPGLERMDSYASLRIPGLEQILKALVHLPALSYFNRPVISL